MSETEEELRLWLALDAVPGLGCSSALALLSRYSIQTLFSLPAEELTLLGLKPQQINAIRYPDESQLEPRLHWADGPNKQIIYITHPAYPRALREISSAPLVLYIEGEPALLSQPQLAIVGSRNATHYGRQKAYDLARSLCREGLTITSGLALGVDGYAHQGALSDGGKTIAVLGSGLNRVYPKRHMDLARQIAQAGTLVSEFWPDSAPVAANFPRRNRIISGLSLGVLVVEASVRSGSLITARYALEQNREVFALPGSIDNPEACGCHHLIQQGAKLVTNTADILEELHCILERLNCKQLNLMEEKNEANELPFPILLDSVGYEATSLDEVVERSGLPVQVVQGQLVEMELLGWIATVPDGYVKLRRS